MPYPIFSLQDVDPRFNERSYTNDEAVMKQAINNRKNKQNKRLFSLEDINNALSYISPGIAIANYIYHKGKGIINYLSSDSKKPVIINLKNKNIRNVSKEKNVNAVLGNEFIERKHNTVRKAKDFKNTTDTLLGDKGIRLRNISQFYGVENNKLKVGSINQFNENTEVVPVRNKNQGKLKKIINDTDTIPDYTQMVESKYPALGLFKGMFMSGQKVKDYNLKRINYRNNLVKNHVPTNNYTIRRSLKGITESGDTVTLHNNLTNKVIFTDENGNAIFVNKLTDDNIRKKVNKILNATPLYPVMLDNGRYSHYSLDGDVEGYVNPLDNKNKMYILGY